LVVVKDSPIHGKGVFATRDIDDGTWILQYPGPGVGAEQKRSMSEEDKVYLFKLSDEYSIDGR
jgi:uncharacterized protein